MKLLRMISKFIELSTWFNRKSQHYILGDWSCYTRDKGKLFSYYLNYPVAYIKFMWMSRRDVIDC